MLKKIPPRPDRRPIPSVLSLPLFLLVGLVLAGCGGVDTVDEATEAAPAADAQFPVDVLSGPLDKGTKVTIDNEPASIVSLSPTATEMLWGSGRRSRQARR